MNTWRFWLLLLLLPAFSPVGRTQAIPPGREAVAAAPALPSGGLLYGYNRFRNKPPFTLKDSVVTFFLRGRKDAREVFLAGNFNNWSSSSLPMHKTDSGWVARVKLMPGKHEYKFIIDGEWEPDLDNLQSNNPGNGSFNSVFYVTNSLFSLPGFRTAKKITLSGSLDSRAGDAVPLTRTARGWQLPLYLERGPYTFHLAVDGVQYISAANPGQYLDPAQPPVADIELNPADLVKDMTAYQNLLSRRKTASRNTAQVKHLLQAAKNYSGTGNYTSALEAFQKAVTLSEDANEDNKELPALYLQLASIYRQLLDLPQELNYLQKALKSSERWENSAVKARALRDLGYFYLNLPHEPTALDYFKRAYNEYELLGDPQEKADILGKIAHTYGLMGKHDRQLEFTRKAMAVNEKMGNESGLAANLRTMGDYYLRVSSDYPRALAAYEDALAKYNKTGDKNGRADVLMGTAALYAVVPDSVLRAMGMTPQERWRKVIDLQQSGLRVFSEGQKARVLPTLFTLSRSYEKSGRYDSALHYYRRYIGMVNEVINVEKQKEIARLEWKYDLTSREEYLKLEKLVTDERLKRQLLLTRQQQQLLTLAQKDKELQHLAYLKTQADLRNEQLTRQQKEKLLQLSQKEQQLQSAHLKSLEQDKAISQLNRQRQWMYSLGAFGLLGLGSLFFIHRSRLRSLRLQSQLDREKAEQEKRQSEFERKLGDVSLTALRSQMNPHFIFNCLNSIKLYTLQNDTATASEYLTKFSRLIRLVLENSRSERVTLTSELTALQLYIEMEAMRFKEKLRYTITVADNVEPDYIEIPPMLLQPYVENAIWHGLMNKEEGGSIAIDATLLQNDQVLRISISDDGIGRAQAAALKSQSATKHRSYGMKVTSDRIALINQFYQAGASVTVHDLVAADGQPAGTQVVLQIPLS